MFKCPKCGPDVEVSAKLKPDVVAVTGIVSLPGESTIRLVKNEPMLTGRYGIVIRSFNLEVENRGITADDLYEFKCKRCGSTKVSIMDCCPNCRKEKPELAYCRRYNDIVCSDCRDKSACDLECSYDACPFNANFGKKRGGLQEQLGKRVAPEYIFQPGQFRPEPLQQGDAPIAWGIQDLNNPDDDDDD